MNKIFINAALLVTSFGLVAGCASNTQGENTAVGAVAGAVVGGVAGGAIGSGGGAVAAGAVIGALLGGVIGNSMESSDSVRTVYIIEHNAPNVPTHWKNVHTGYHYSVTPLSRQMAWKGHPNCRKFRAVMYSHGKKEKVVGVACRRPDGTWRAI